MNRIDRVTAILIQLQSKRIVKAQEIATRFHISLRTVYRDIKTLEEAGIPLHGEAGSGYSLMEGYRLPPVMFTPEEAAAFITAEKLIEKLTDASTEESYKSAMYKVRAVLRSGEKDLLEEIDNRIEVIRNPWMKPSANAINPLQTILKSISRKNVLAITYNAGHSQEMTERNVEPAGIFFQGSNWHLLAFCRLRNDYRDFRIDRIAKLSVSNSLFTKQHPILKEFLKKITKEKDLVSVVIRVNKSFIRYLQEQKFYQGFVSEKMTGDDIEMTFLSSSLEGFARWFIMFGDHAEILSPKALKTAVQSLLGIISERLNDT